jgi:hypothetical protein
MYTYLDMYNAIKNRESDIDLWVMLIREHEGSDEDVVAALDLALEMAKTEDVAAVLFDLIQAAATALYHARNLKIQMITLKESE